jgi:RNA polymerase sigma factor (TIGR02999 family)
MPASRRPAVTQILAEARNGDAGALDRLLPILYDELRGLAHRERRRRGAAETLGTTALVHEAYEKLARADGGWSDRAHFFRVAATAMRQVIVDYARAQHAQKRGGGPARSLTNVPPLGLAVDADADDVLALDMALDRLAELDARQSEVVQLRYFAGLTVPEAAEVLDVSPATVKRDWTAARAWLHREIGHAA